ncbi:MAG: NUDIX domain-containing protein [Clostridia bacterium]|nr:NUDIX domain-containing protein [Clostridia bacterium]
MSFNEFNATKSTRSILGGVYNVTVTSTYFLYSGGKRSGMLNCGKVLHAQKEVKAFVIGTNEPCKSFRGQVVAIAKDRLEKEEDVWILAPEKTVIYEPKLVSLLEKYLPGDRYKYVCYYEKSCGAVMFTEIDGVRKFILITNISGHIGFPKGHIEMGEDEKQTALREVYEETGVATQLVEGFRESYNYLINGFIRKKAVYFLAPFNARDVKMNIMEISEYRLVTYEEALSILNFKHDRDILTKANQFIDSRKSDS